MLGTAAVPGEADALEADPGVIVIVQVAPGAKEAPQVVELAVPKGRPGLSVMPRDTAEIWPVLVTINTRGDPLAIPSTVSPLTDNAIDDELSNRVVVSGGLSVQPIDTVVIFAVTLVPK